MAIAEYAVLRNRTDKAVEFTFDGETKIVKPQDKFIAEAGLVRFLYETSDQLHRLSADGRRVFALGIEECPKGWQDVLDIECFDTDAVVLKATRETPDLAASRAAKFEPVNVSPADFRPDAETR